MRTLRLASVVALCLTARPVVAADDLVRWRTLAKGEAEAKKSGKAVLYFITADWCGPCRTMKQEVFSDPDVVKKIEVTFVPVQVVDRSREEGSNAPEVNAIFRKFRLRGFPTLTVSRPGSRQAYQAAGWQSKRATVEFLSIARTKFEDLEKAEREAKR